MKRAHFFILLCLMATLGVTAQQRYADHSVLAEGRWTKIRIPATGIYELTDSLLAQAGITDAKHVKVYGYGGAWQPEKLTASYLKATDDLKEVPQYVSADGRRLFFGVGPLNWESATTLPRQLNPYSSYGYYFLTETADEPLTLDSAAFVSASYPHPNDYHALYEIDDFSWYDGGRNLYDAQSFGEGVAHSYSLPAYASSGVLQVMMSYNTYCKAEILVNDSLVGYIDVSTTTTKGSGKKAFPDSHSVAAVDSWAFPLPQGLKADNTITIRQLSGGDMRLDYLVLVSDSARVFEGLSASFDVPEFVSAVSPQDLHADGPADMVIVIPANRIFYDEAQRLAQMHQEMDGLRVRIVAADELYNEFSSGTPDANAYRRYLKMFYDRAQTDNDKPRYLLLLGDGVWDNRMILDTWKRSGLTPDDMLICYESNNSFSETQCFVSDDYFCMLDDDEDAAILSRNRSDVAVGRLPARTVQDAKTMVDKTIRYRKNTNAGPWQNVLFFMGDDGDNNRHMRDAEAVADSVARSYGAYDIRRVYWDAYKRVSTMMGDRYPDVEHIVKKQMADGALVMNYTGHGSANDFSHEYVLTKNDFATIATDHLPLWVTASCNIMPFDGKYSSIGEVAMLNPKGGAVAFFGTTRTVYATKNMPINRAFMHYVLGTNDEGQRITIGEAARLAKISMIDTGLDLAENKLQYSLLGDPALSLVSPTMEAVIDSINGQSVDEGVQTLPAGSGVTVTGHIVDGSDFCGQATLTVKDALEHVVGRQNEGQSVAYEYDHRPNILYVGTDSVIDGRFAFTFALPIDISYAEGEGQMLVYAVNREKTQSAHGESFDFVYGINENTPDDEEGPVVQCYLDYAHFVDGGTTTSTPFFYARLSDDDGINVSGNGFGHDMELVIDGELMRTYNLNDYFIYEYGDYRRGEVGFTIPWLPNGLHQLTFRAWDVFNHSTVVTLSFKVDSSFDPTGIQGVMNDKWFDRRREMMQGQVYDVLGHYVGTQVPRKPGLYIFKSNRGLVKKIMVPAQ